MDHVSPIFAELVEVFLTKERQALEQIQVEVSHEAQVEAVLSDPDLQQRWVRFHNRSVTLRIVSVEGHRLHHVHIGDAP